MAIQEITFSLDQVRVEEELRETIAGFAFIEMLGASLTLALFNITGFSLQFSKPTIIKVPTAIKPKNDVPIFVDLFTCHPMDHFETIQNRLTRLPQLILSANSSPSLMNFTEQCQLIC